MHDTLIQGCIGVSTLLEAASHAQDVSPAGMRERVARVGGEFHLASSPGHGTQVRFTLPAVGPG
jgi:glucose-6-phosphate-specific signal transduction histidine kinase